MGPSAILLGNQHRGLPGVNKVGQLLPSSPHQLVVAIAAIVWFAPFHCAAAPRPAASLERRRAALPRVDE